jgi:3D (Asp-Asp-Asp) domain-containing protein
VLIVIILILIAPAQVIMPLPAIEEITPSRGERVLIMEATAYCYTGNKTKTGTWPKVGTVAVDPKVIPLGTQLHIEGYGSGVAEDTGGMIKGNRIDLYMNSEREALNWGRRWVRVEVRG